MQALLISSGTPRSDLSRFQELIPCERQAERVGPGEHGRATHEQDERGSLRAEVLGPQRDAIQWDRRDSLCRQVVRPS